MPQLFDTLFTTKPEGNGARAADRTHDCRCTRGRIWPGKRPRGGAVFRFTLRTMSDLALA
jgi:hypothetical protein